MKVFQAMNAVQSEMAKVGIAKSSENQQQRYKFRGIDDMYNALAPMLARHQLLILPKVLSREVVERQAKNGGALFYVTVQVDFYFTSAEDGSHFVVTSFGEAMDSADKATNKAMSAAYKYACIQSFCIPTEGDNDADSTTYEPLAAARAELLDAIERNAESIAVIQHGIKEGLLSEAAEAWFELSEDVKRSLWVAPTKGGPFTTEERRIMATSEFRKSFYGEAA